MWVALMAPTYSVWCVRDGSPYLPTGAAQLSSKVMHLEKSSLSSSDMINTVSNTHTHTPTHTYDSWFDTNILWCFVVDDDVHC